MNREDMKFRYYRGEKTETSTFSKEIDNTFYQLEKIVAKDYGVDGVNIVFKHLYVKGSKYCPAALFDLGFPDGEKAVFLTCCNLVGGYPLGEAPDGGKELINAYFTNRIPFVADIAEHGKHGITDEDFAWADQS